MYFVKTLISPRHRESFVALCGLLGAPRYSTSRLGTCLRAISIKQFGYLIILLQSTELTVR